MDKIYSYYVYILTNKTNTVFYTGFTNNLLRRTIEHKLKISDGFSKKYKTFKLVYFEHFTNVYLAIRREKRLKRWNKEWKLEIIKKSNPEMKDLIYDLLDENGIKEMEELLKEENKSGIPAKNMRG
ncbi:MAG: GIY-YIG nuclease family protein [Ignavibacteriae bacterium]|nr:GIY-YIG nuclease family protein [Ignavibacteriota bacterium]